MLIDQAQHTHSSIQLGLQPVVLAMQLLQSPLLAVGGFNALITEGIEFSQRHLCIYLHAPIVFYFHGPGGQQKYFDQIYGIHVACMYVGHA